MPLTQANVPNVLDADVEIDVSGDNDFVVSTDLKADIIGFDPTGGDHNYDSFMPWDSSTLVGVGGANPDVWTLTFIYTDGEATDVWDTVIAAKGNEVAVRVIPKGDTTGNRGHTIIGRLVDVAQPNQANNAGFQYQIVVVGDASAAAV